MGRLQLQQRQRQALVVTVQLVMPRLVASVSAISTHPDAAIVYKFVYQMYKNLYSNCIKNCPIATMIATIKAVKSACLKRQLSR